MFKPKLKTFNKPKNISDLPNGTYFEAGHLVSKNAGWRTKRPVIDTEKCIGCLQCYLYCPDGVIEKAGNKVNVDYDFCKGCGICVKICKTDAIKMEAER
jgi:2-oxoacid:acceptor oxidoreductase delta subunit (pyruvate/2-ketoisovalerate family)